MSGTSKKITELPPNSVKLITATQIATSVSNIIKELVENSLDAGSSIIRVKLENSGLSKIEVLDNGSGVSKENVTVMALPHYTSKITQHQDLESLTTYGFRGEALSSICAVSKVSVTTRTNDDQVASTYSFDPSGNVVDVKPSHLSQGTSIVVSQLFYNVPVRKQYYQTPKRKKDELSKVEDLLLHFGLMHPELHLSLHHDHCLVWQKSRVSDFKANIFQILGYSISSHMEFVSEESMFKIFLMVPKSNAPTDICFRHKADRSFIFINERQVISKEIDKTMREMYGKSQDPACKTKLYPIYIVSLHFPGDEIDVNLEPNKTQVLMKRQAEVLEFIRNKVSDILSNEKVNSDATPNPEQLPIHPNQEKPPRSEPLEVFEEKEAQFSLCPADDGVMEVSVDLFHGFCEPFSLPDEKSSQDDQPIVKDGPISIGSSEWSKGLAKDASGRIVHPVEILRGEPHFAKRITEPPLSSSLPKKPKLLPETQDALKIIGPSPRKLETINGKVRSSPSDPYEEYCKSMKPELMSQNPTMTFNELTQHLSQGWKNLNKSCREKYENKAETGRQRHGTKLRSYNHSALKGGPSLDRFLCPQTPVVRATTSSTGLTKSVSIRVDFSFDKLMLGNVPSPNDEKWKVVTKFETPSKGWLCSNGKEIMAVNFSRLYEIILYSRLIASHPLPSRFTSNPIIINPLILRNADIWNLLKNLPSEGETASSTLITDERVVANGLAIRLCADATGTVTYAQVFKIPAEVDRFDLKDVIQFLECLYHERSSVETCRPDYLKKNIQVEAARLSAARCNDPDDGELCHLLQQWCTLGYDNVCLHGDPVVWHHVISNEEEFSDTMDDMLFSLID